MAITKNDILFYIGLTCAVWFALAGTVWAYWAALIIAYPFGIISFVIWRLIKNETRKRNKFIPLILAVGLILSLTILIYLLIWE